MKRTGILHTLVAVLFCLIVPQSQAAFKSTGVPRFDQAVHRAVGYLKAPPKPALANETSLVAYALLKTGEPITSPLVAKGLADALRRADKTGYSGYEHIYWCGVDAMLLADIDPEKYKDSLQRIVDHVSRAQRSDGSWAESPARPGDCSMAQYGMMALWAADRAECTIQPAVVEKATNWFLKGGAADGAWNYRPGTKEGHEHGATTHTMAMAGAGGLSIARMLFYGPKTPSETKAKPKKFGVLESVVETDTKKKGAGRFAEYSPKVAAGQLDSRIDRAFNWNETRFSPNARNVLYKNYFFYSFERAAAIHEVKTVAGKDWYTVYGDGLLSYQEKHGGFENSAEPDVADTCFAVLFFMRATKQILDKQFGKGRMTGSRDLASLYGKKKQKKELGPLDELLGAMMTNVEDLNKLDAIELDDVVEKVQVSNRAELIGQVEMLKKLLESRSADNRRIAYWALSRTGDFSLIPLMLQGLRDPNVDCNVEALLALRYVARKPNGFGLSLEPLAGAETADNERKIEVANQWRTKAYRTWGDWYRKTRPYNEGGGLEELELSGSAR